MFYTVYQTTNTINNKIYIGTHITNNPNDDYLGSGVNITRAINKYDANSFIKTILFSYDNADEMFTKEAELVNEEFINRHDTYNIMPGGYGGWDFINKAGLNVITNLNPKLGGKIGGDKVKWLWKNDPIFVEITRKKISKGLQGNKLFFGHKHKSETIKQMKISHKGKHSGSKNSMYGRCWVTNGKDNKSIPKKELDIYINMGYYKGRKL